METDFLTTRPELLSFKCLADMYRSFERLFLGAEGSSSRNHVLRCGHTVTALEHNFFHMVKMTGPEGQHLFMREEKEKILACTENFGAYKFEHNDHRAKYLLSALDTMEDPDQIFECDNLKTAKYSFVKEYKSKPYPFTVFLISTWESLLVPATSFQCRRNDSKKWRCGKLIYARNTNATP
jgi:hypothetical protein